ncbi:MAG: amino acid racemase [Oscillospiraceae bacterium]
MKTLGVIGGVGPLSTAYFMEVLINMTDAQTDQQHINMIVLNHTEIPDRTAYILGKSQESPVPIMVEDAKKLQSYGAEVIVTPCNTAHYFYNQLSKSVQVPFINMIYETALQLKQDGISTAGIMATNGTIAANLFQDSLKSQGIKAITPSAISQQKVMDIIYQQVKASKPVNQNDFDFVVDELKSAGCQKIILGCTELSILKRDYNLSSFYIDALEVLCKKSILMCGGKLKETY